MARLTNNYFFFFASIFYPRKLAKVDNCKKHEYLFAGLIRNDSEVATMTVKLWSNMFTGKSSTVLQLSFHDGISFLPPNWQTISCFINLLRKIKLAKVENFENMRTFLLHLMGNDSEVVTMTVDLWCKRFTGKKLREAFII